MYVNRFKNNYTHLKTVNCMFLYKKLEKVKTFWYIAVISTSLSRRI